MSHRRLALPATLLLALVLAPATARAWSSTQHHLALVNPSDRRVQEALAATGVPVEAPTPDGLAEVVLTDAERAWFEARGVPHRVIQEDLESFYAERLAQTAPPLPPAGWNIVNPPFGQGGMGGYHTLAEMEAILDLFTAAAPNIVTPRWSIGTSIEGRNIWAIKISDNPNTDENEPETRFDSLHHAREPVSMEMTLFFMEWLIVNYGSDPVATWLVDERELYFVPVVNPDGYEYNYQQNPGGGGMWRKNRRQNADGSYGVDPNRNYSFQWGYDNNGSSPNPGSQTYRGQGPASEPEIQAMEAFFASRTFTTANSAHTYSNLWLYPWGYTCTPPADQPDHDLIGQYFTEDSGYVFGPACSTLYPVNGDTVDHDYGTFGTYSGTVEIGSNADGFWPPLSRLMPLMQENLRGYQRLAMYAGAGLEPADLVWTEASGDGDAWLEPGETFDLALYLVNAGTQATGTSVVADLSSASPDVVVTVGNHDFGSVAAFTAFDNAASPLQIQVAANASAGATATLALDVSHDGYTLSQSLTVVVGEALPVWLDDFEVDRGWVTGLPTDTATSGRWELADPAATSSGGQPIQPGNDASPNGVRCAVTDGRAGAGAGTYDVDDGETTLLSPEFDLEDAVAPQLRYWRWYADLGGTPDNDDFEIEISNDGGASWVPLETVSRTQNAWTEVVLPLAGVLPLSDRMQLKFVAQDAPNDSLCEALVDDLSLEVFNPGAYLTRYGVTLAGAPLSLALLGQPGERFLLFAAPAGGWLDLGGLGIWELDLSQQAVVLRGGLDGQGQWGLDGSMPPGTSGLTVHLQAFLLGGAAGPRVSNAIDFAIQ